MSAYHSRDVYAGMGSSRCVLADLSQALFTVCPVQSVGVFVLPACLQTGPNFAERACNTSCQPLASARSRSRWSSPAHPTICEAGASEARAWATAEIARRI